MSPPISIMSIVSFDLRPKRGRLGIVTTQDLANSDSNEEAAAKLITNLQNVQVRDGGTEDFRWDTGVTGWLIRVNNSDWFVHYAYDAKDLVIVGSGANRQLADYGNRSFGVGEVGQLNITHPNIYNTDGSHILYDIHFCATNSSGNLKGALFSIELYQAPGT